MHHPLSIMHVYGEFVHTPYFVIVHSNPRSGHARFDQYQPGGLTELMLSVVEHLTAGRSEYLDKMVDLDQEDKARSKSRTRRYIATRQEDIYAEKSQNLAAASVQYKGYWFSTNAKHTQTRKVVELACRACGVPYSSVRQFKAFAK